MEEQAEEVRDHLSKKFGERVNFSYVDVQSKEMKKHTAIKKIVGKVRLPLMVINDEPRFQGGLSAELIEEAIGELLL
jgi:disulfide oxidoreductase YuzD